MGPRAIGVPFILSLAIGYCHAQSVWHPMYMPGYVMSPQLTVYSDTATGTIYYGGLHPLTVGGGGAPGTLFSWKNSTWDTSATAGNIVSDFIRWHDTLFVCGGFSTLNSIPAKGVAYWNGSSWLPYGLFDTDAWVKRFRIIEDTLYAVGGIQSVDGVPMKGAIKRSGGVWLEVAEVPALSIILNDIIKYNGQLIAVGGASGGLSGRIFYVVNGEWQMFAPGIVGGNSTVTSLAEFNDDLYIGGSISALEGNPGWGILRYDGTSLSAVGNGVSEPSSWCGVHGMQVHNGLLYVNHSCSHAGGLYAPGLATWDGAHWCALKGVFVDSIGSWPNDIAFLNDTLYATVGNTLDGMNPGSAAWALVADLLDTCAAYVGVQEPSSRDHPWLYPDPASDVIHIQLNPQLLLQLDRTEIRLDDATGRRVLVVPLRSHGSVISVDQFPPGVYTVSIFSDGQMLHCERIVIAR